MEWKTVKIADIGDVYSGGTPSSMESSYWNGSLPWLSSGETSQRYIYNTERSISEEGVKHSSTRFAQKGSIVMASAGQGHTRGQVSMLCIDTYVNQSVLVIKPDLRKIDPSFLFFNLDGRYNELRQLSDSASTRGSISGKILKDLPINLPSLEDQHRIASILSSLDDKIENNNRINRNLEAQAQALFKSWFVNFEPWGGTMPEDWKEVSLNEMTSKFGTGLNPRKNFKLGEGENYYVTIKNMGNNRVYLDDRCDKVTDEAIEKINKRSKLQAGDLLFSGIGTIGRVALVTETPTNWNTSESVFNLHPANNISSEFLYVLLLSDVFQNYVKVHAQGGVQQGIRMASLKDYKMYIPEDSKMKQFDSHIIPIITRIKNIDKENDRLATLRDTLLPKLMRGEITL